MTWKPNGGADFPTTMRYNGGDARFFLRIARNAGTKLPYAQENEAMLPPKCFGIMYNQKSIRQPMPFNLDDRRLKFMPHTNR